MFCFAQLSIEAYLQSFYFFCAEGVKLTFEIRGAEAQPREVKSAAFNRPG